MTTAALFLLAALAAAPAPAADNAVSLAITPPAGPVPLAEVFEIKVKASLTEAYTLRPDTATASNSEFQVLSFTRTDETKVGARKTESYTIEAKPFTLGVSTFPALSWLLEGKDLPGGMRVQSSTFTVEVLPLFKDAEQSDIRDIRPPYAYPNWLLRLALLALAALAYYAWRRFKAGKGNALFAAGPWQDTRSPYQRALYRLARLHSSPLIEKGRFKAYYTGLTSILRLYLAEEFRIEAELMTTADLARELKQTGAELATLIRTRELLQKADLVKFAKLVPADAGDDRAALEALLKEFNIITEHTRALEAAAKAEAELAARKRGWRP